MSVYRVRLVFLVELTSYEADWQKTGKVVAQLGKKYGFEEIFLSRITNDVLLAASARKIGGAIVTNNLKDFLRIQEYIDFKIYKG